jgi:hypothetical protein
MSAYLQAESGIRLLHARYADAVFRKDFVSFGDCFTDNAEWLVGGFHLTGRAECVEFLQNVMARINWVLMTFRTPILQLSDATADGRTYVTEQTAYKDGGHSNNIATYFERFVEQDGIWRRSYAFFQLHYMGPADFTGSFFPQPDFGPPPAMPPMLPSVPPGNPQ